MPVHNKVTSYLHCFVFRSHTLIVPQYWLCYLAPELIRNLSEELIQLPFSESSDVFAFGSVLIAMIYLADVSLRCC